MWCLLTMFQNYNHRLRSTFQQIIHTYVTLLKMTDRFREWSVFKTLIYQLCIIFFEQYFLYLIRNLFFKKLTKSFFHFFLTFNWLVGDWSFSYQKNDQMALSSEIDQSDVPTHVFWYFKYYYLCIGFYLIKSLVVWNQMPFDRLKGQAGYLIMIIIIKAIIS